MLDEIPRTPVDSIALAASANENDHGRTAFDLLREVAQCTAVFAGALKEGSDDWSLSEAVIGGHFVRLAKLLRAFLQQVVEERAELAWVTSRLAAESVINIIYLVTNFSDALIRSYVLHSLHHDGELLNTINTNIAARGGQQRPIEARMLRSIARTFENVQLTAADLPKKRMQNWDNRTLKEKARSLGLADVYQVAIGAASRNVHGGWYDLTQHHLEVVSPGRFKPQFEDIRVRPQLMYAMSVMSLNACASYLAFIEIEQAQHDRVRSRLAEMDTRIRTADRLHEEFLTRRQRAV